MSSKNKKSQKKDKVEIEEKKEVAYLVGAWEEIHGFRGSEKWQAPKLAVYCDEEARPGYDTKKAHEYLDSDEVFAEKIKLLADLIKQSKNMIAYTGAGISTGAGIGDYASKAGSKSIALSNQPKIKSNLSAEPTYAHRAVTQLFHEGYLKMWIQQNHDGLPQKAGMPQWGINEIHGAWFDPSNAVVAMSGSLRDDLFGNMLEWEEKTDLCLAMGTSLSGMNADRVVETVGQKALAGEDGFLGAVIVSIQQTRLDHVAALRIFAKIDRVMEALANELGITVPKYKLYKPEIPSKNKGVGDIVKIQFDEEGMPTEEGKTSILDLRVGKFVMITGGSHKGDFGIVDGVNPMGHYKILFAHLNKASMTSGEFKGVDLKMRLLGNWWLEAGVQGRGVVPGGLFPVVSIPEKQIPAAILEVLTAKD
jgi:NAD-dependent SIR2 family protein deacetylase